MNLKDEIQKMNFPNRKAGEFHRRAAEFIEKQKATGNPNLAIIKPKTDEWSAWERYFRWYGWEPKAWTMVRKGGDLATITLPAQWPEWFDTEFALADVPDAPPPRQVEPRHLRKTLEELQARYGKSWGLRGGRNRPLPADRIQWRDGRKRAPELIDDGRPEERAESSEARLARLAATPLPDVSPELVGILGGKAGADV